MLSFTSNHSQFAFIVVAVAFVDERKLTSKARRQWHSLFGHLSYTPENTRSQHRLPSHVEVWLLHINMFSHPLPVLKPRLNYPYLETQFWPIFSATISAQTHTKQAGSRKQHAHYNKTLMDGVRSGNPGIITSSESEWGICVVVFHFIPVAFLFTLHLSAECRRFFAFVPRKLPSKDEKKKLWTRRDAATVAGITRRSFVSHPLEHKRRCH